MHGSLPSPGRLLLIGDRAYVLDVALDIVSERSSPLSVFDVDHEFSARLGIEGEPLLAVELSVPYARRDRARRRAGDLGALIGQMVGSNLADIERALILATLKKCDGNRTSAATILGISVRTMRNKLRLFMDEGMPVPPPPLPGSGVGTLKRSN